MFTAARIAPIVFVAPWALDLDERIRMLMERPRRIAYFYEEPDGVMFRYRVFNMVKSVAAIPNGDTSASWFMSRDLPQMDRFIGPADALVVCRARYTPDLERLIDRAKTRGIPVIFDIDDLIFDTTQIRLVMETLDDDPAQESKLDFWFALVSRLGATLRMCDRAIVTNGFLAGRIRAAIPGFLVSVLPNFLNVEQQRLSHQLYDAKQESGFARDGRIHLGYFSGSPSHNRDFAIVSRVLARLLDEEPRLVLRIVGYLDNNELLMQHSSQIEVHPMQDFINLQRLIAEVEINIAPLQENHFTNCKSELKFFEAAIVGSITAASPAYSFRQAIVTGKNGFLVNAGEWEQALRDLIAIVDRPVRYAEIAERGFRDAERAYGWDVHGKSIVETVFGSPSGKEPGIVTPGASAPR